MSIATSDKIFVDVNDEINFVVEKILASQRERVIVVVPQNAVVVSSIVSMKILSHQILRSKKQIVLVTEDELGLKLAKQANIISTNKVSNVSAETWEAAKAAKESLLRQRDELKSHLLAERGISSANFKKEGELDVDIMSGESVFEQPSFVPDQAADNKKPELETEAEAISEDEAISESEDVENSVAETAVKSDLELEDVQGPIKRTRRQPKLVDLSGIQVYAGGDIADLSRVTDSQPRVTTTKPTRADYSQRDWAGYIESPSKRTIPFLSSLRPKKDLRSVSPGVALGKRKALIGALIFAVVAVVGAGLIVWQTSTVEIIITLKTEEVPVEQQVVADANLLAFTSEPLSIPALMVEETDLSSSESGTSTGEGQKGTAAAGLIDIWNKTTAEITLSAGTVLENTTTNLKYTLKQDVTIRGRDPDDDLDIGQAKDVRIEAETFGEQYNITESGTKVDFKVGTYTTSDVIGKRFRNIEGGTTVAFAAPAQVDVDLIKNSLVESLKKQGIAKVRTNVPEGYRLLEGTTEFTETAVRPVPAVGEEGSSFSVTVEGKVTVLAVKNDDLDSAIKLLIDNNQLDAEGEFEVTGLGDTELTNIVREGDKATFTVTAKGSLQSKITEEAVKSEVAGLEIDTAYDRLVKIDEVENVRISFSPALAPKFLQQVPGDWMRIKVTFK